MFLIDNQIEDAEFIEITDEDYSRSRDTLRLINMKTSRIEMEKRQVKWKVNI